MQTLLVTDNTEFWQFCSEKTRVVNSSDYISNLEYANGESYRIINLCDAYSYQSLGYYVSLLAEARGHKIFPSVLTIQDIASPTLSEVISAAVSQDIQHMLRNIKSEEFVLSIYFGKNIASRYESLCRKLHGLFPVPLFRVYFKYNKEWYIKRIKPLAVSDIPESHGQFLVMAAEEYFSKKRFHPYRRKKTHYDLAILYNPEEKTPPSNLKALKKFIEAGEELGIEAELIDKNDFKFLAEYDALFIRETTAVNHHTFLFARKASSEDMVVIDDPASILKCTNKVYLAEVLNKHHLSIPKTWILNQHNKDINENEISYPCVLKRPDSCFSQGVIKVESPDDLKLKAKTFFKNSELIIAQAFIPTEYDWRIGIIDNIPLFACRYYMALGHWQIYNWHSEKERTGLFDCVAISEVPETVLHAALKAAKLIGEGLYGVDLKQIGDKVYIIEVNDNPNLDYGVEDQVIGEDLYLTVMKTFLKRIRRKHGYE